MRNKADPYDALSDNPYNTLYSGTFTLTDEMGSFKGLQLLSVWSVFFFFWENQ